MARAPSVILTPAEKKMAVSNAKEAAKQAKVALNTLTKTRTAAEKEYASALKDLKKTYDSAVATATKTFTALTKESDKALKNANAAVTKADADLLKLVPTVAPTVTAAAPVVEEKAVPTPTE